MSVESKALDDAFAGASCKPRQRLIAASIEYAVDELDCATAEFTDPDGRIASCIRTAPTKVGNQLIFVPWTVRIGYYGQDPEEMTKLVGVPQMEFPDWPETGDPVVRLKVMNSSVALKTNVAPGGDPANYLEPLSKGVKNGPFYRALAAVADFYGLGLDLGSLEAAIDEIDIRLTNDIEAKELGNNLDPIDAMFTKAGEWESAPTNAYAAMTFSRIPATVHNNKVELPFESDYNWLRRTAAIVTSLIADGSLEATRHYTEYFNSVLPGKIHLADIKVIVGIHGENLVYKCNYDLIMENGFSEGIPVLDYRNGNRLLRSFTPSADSSNESMGFFATLFGNKKKKKGDIDAEPPLTDAELRSTDDPAEVNPYTVDKRLFFPQAGSDGASGTVAWIDELKRHMATGITGDALTYGIPKLLAGQLVGLAGLGWGPAAEVATDLTAAEEQPFANYNRLYFTNRVKHIMDASGLYSMQLKVAACALDGSETKVIKSFLDRLKKGVEFSLDSSGILGVIFGSTI
jgi:hypothetical protein